MEAVLARPPARPPRRKPVAAGLQGGFLLGRVAGIEVRAHASWLVIAALIVLTLQAEFGVRHAGLPPARLWAAAAIAAALFFGSILAHELAHSLVARARGIGVQGITLFVFGGVSRLKGEAERPRDELVIALVGPLASAALGAAFLALGRLPAAGGLPADVLHWLGRTNVALAVFNLLPGFPLDGGRVFRAAAWSLTGSLRKATRLAALAGVVVAELLIALGIFLALALRWTGDGLWLVVLGFFLLSAARGSAVQFEVHDMLGRLRVADAMDVSLAFVPPGERVQDLVDERILRGRRESFAVEDETGVLGFVTVPDILAVPRERRPFVTAGEIMAPLEGAASASLDTPLREALGTMDDLGVDRLAVLENGVLRGLLRREDVLRRTALHVQLGSSPDDSVPPGGNRAWR